MVAVLTAIPATAPDDNPPGASVAWIFLGVVGWITKTESVEGERC